MKFINYLNENDLNINQIKENCSEILKFYNKIDNFLYRGINKSKNFLEFVPKTNRKPRNIELILHNIFDEEFKKKFGWKARSEGVFVIGSPLFAKNFGEVYIIFPFDGFKFIWSPKIFDLYLDTIGLSNSLELNKDIKKIVNTYQNKNLDIGINLKHEIMIKTIKYYAINKIFFDKNLKEILLG